MTERAYTLTEIDALRQACERVFWYGSAFVPMVQVNANTWVNAYMGRTAPAGECERETERLLRAYMAAGVTAEELVAEHRANPPNEMTLRRQRVFPPAPAA